MATTTASVTVRWTLPVGEARAMLDVLHRIMADTRQQRGCRQCSAEVVMADQASISFSEKWADEDALQRELCSQRFAWLVALIESSSAPPLIEFLLPEGRRGLDYAEGVRARHSG